MRIWRCSKKDTLPLKIASPTSPSLKWAKWQCFHLRIVMRSELMRNCGRVSVHRLSCARGQMLPRLRSEAYLVLDRNDLPKKLSLAKQNRNTPLMKFKTPLVSSKSPKLEVGWDTGYVSSNAHFIYGYIGKCIRRTPPEGGWDAARVSPDACVRPQVEAFPCLPGSISELLRTRDAFCLMFFLFRKESGHWGHPVTVSLAFRVWVCRETVSVLVQTFPDEAEQYLILMKTKLSIV